MALADTSSVGRYIIWSLIVLGSSHIQLQRRITRMEHETGVISTFLRGLMHYLHPDCVLVFAHDFARHNSPEKWPLTRLNSDYRVVFHMTGWAEGSPDHQMELETYSSQKVGRCMVHLVTSRDVESFGPLLTHMRRQVRVQLDQDILLVWLRSGDLMAILLRGQLTGFKFKLGLEVTAACAIRPLTVCFFCHEGHPRLVNLPSYHGDDTYFNTGIEIFPDMTLDLGGRAIRVAFMNRMDFDEVKSAYIKPGGHRDLESHFLIFYWIATKMNFVYTTDLMQPIELLEERLDNGSFVGSVDHLLKGKCDVAYMSRSSDESLRFIDFGYPIYFVTMRFVTGRPRVTELASWEGVIRPFSYGMWSLIFATLLMSAAFLAAMMREDFRSAFMSSLSHCARSLIEQNPEVLPRSDSYRMFFAFWLYLGMVMGCGYKEMLFSFLTIPVRETLPQSFQDIPSSPFQTAIPFGHFIFLKSSVEDAKIQLFTDLFDNSETPADEFECMKQCLVKRTACISFSLILEIESASYVDRHGKDLLVLAPAREFFMYSGSSFRKDSVIRGTYSQVVKGLVQGGLIDYTFRVSGHIFFRRGLASARNKEAYTISDLVKHDLKSLEFGNLHSSFLLIPIGWCLAILAFLVELCAIG